MKEKNIRELAKHMGLITVENMCQYTIAQLVVMVANKVNELIGEVGRFETDVQEILKTQNEKIQYLLGEGLHLEVENIFDGWLQDGTFDTLINQSALKKVNDRIDETNTQFNTHLSKIAILFNNGEDIQDKLNQLDSNVTVKFAKGTYEVDQPYTINNKTNITFDLSDATFIQRKHGYCVFELSNCSDIEIIGGEIVGAGNFYPQTVNNVTKLLVNEKLINEVNGLPSDWGKSKNGENSSTKTPYNGGYLTNVGYGILLIEGNSNVTISGTECRDFNYVGIGVGHIGKIDGEINRNITVQNCHCHGNFSAGMHFMHVDGFLVTGNCCENNGHPDARRDDFDCNPGYGITCRSSVARPVNGVIANNIFKNNKRKGIDVHAGNHVLIKGNIVEDCYRWGIALTRFNAQVDNMQVIDNTIRSCAYTEGGAGILCDSGGYNIIDGNKIYGSAIKSNAIYCIATNATVTNNVIIDSSTTGDTAHAVLLWNSEVDFVGNVLRESGSKTCVRAYPRNGAVVNIKDNRIFHSTNVHKIFNSVLTDTDNGNVNVIGNTISGNESESIDFQSLKNTSGIIDGNIFNGHVYLDNSCDFIIGTTNKGFKSIEKKSKTMPVGTVTSTCIVIIKNGVISFEDNNHIVTDVTNHKNGLTIHVGDRLIKGISWMHDGTETQDVTDVRLRGIYTNNTADFSLYKANGNPYGNPSTEITESRLAFIVSVI